MNMKKLKSLLLLITVFTLLIASEIFAAPNNEGQEAFIVTKEDIKPNAQRTLLSTTYSVIDKEGNIRKRPNARSYDIGDWAIVTHNFYDRGYESVKNSHFYEVDMTATLIVSDASFSKSIFSVKPKGNKKYLDSTLYHSGSRAIADSIYYGYSGDGPSNPSVYAKEKLYLYGDSTPIESLVDYMRRPLAP